VLARDGIALIHDPNDGMLEAHSASDGTIRWSFPAPGGDLRTVAATDPDTAYVVTWDYGRPGTLTALDIDSGAVRWTHGVDAIADASLTVDAEALLLGVSLSQNSDGVDAIDQGRLVAFDPATGIEAWRQITRDGTATVPVRIGNHLLVVSSDQPIFCD